MNSMQYRSKYTVISVASNHNDRFIPGEGTQLFFGGCVPGGFQNVGSREWIFLEKWGSWE